MQKTAKLPTIRTDKEFKEKVFSACESINLGYSQVVTRLLEKWLSGNVSLDIELSDKQFAQAVTEAMNSPEGQSTLNELEKHYDPNREYPEAIKI